MYIHGFLKLLFQGDKDIIIHFIFFYNILYKEKNVYTSEKINPFY